MSRGADSVDPHALPQHPSSLIDDPVGQRHWLIILAAETHYRLSPGQPRAEAKYNENLIGVRVYGCLLLDCAEHASDSEYGLTAYRVLCDELASIHLPSASASESNLEKCFQEIAARGIYYGNLLLRVFRPNMHYASEYVTHSEERQSFLQKTLARDGNKCVVSGIFDSDTFDSLTVDEQDRLVALGVGKLAYLEVARIFPQPAQDVGSGKEENLDANPTMSLLKLFGVDEPLAMETLDGLSNVMMMTPDLHKAFARLDFWLEEVHGRPNTYKVRASPRKRRSIQLLGAREELSFAVHSEAAASSCGEQVPPLPSRSLLAIRAACSRVAHASGALDQLNEVEREMETMGMLREDGCMAGLLALRLSQLVPVLDWKPAGT